MLLAQSIPQKEFPINENFANPQTDKTAADKRITYIQQLANIRYPHEHDVLMGRGNFVNYHPGNLYFRTLVKKHFLQYISSCKNDKCKYADLIIDEVSMRSPPGRFLRQNLDTKQWFSIDHKKALDKTRQALREGAPDIKTRVKSIFGQEGGENNTCHSGERERLSPNASDNFSKISSQKSIITPLHVGSLDNATLENNQLLSQTPLAQPTPPTSRMTLLRMPNDRSLLMNSLNTTNASGHAILSTNNTPINARPGHSAAANKIFASEKLANSVAARLMSSSGIANENIENLVALGILAALNGGVNANNNCTRNTISPMITSGQNRMPDQPPREDLVVSNSKTVQTMAVTDDSLVCAVASGVAKISDLSSMAAKTSKRPFFSRQMSDISMISNKRFKHAVSFPLLSGEKDSIGAEALIAMSHVDDEKRKDDSSDEESNESSDKNTATPLPPESIPLALSNQTRHSNGDGIWSTPSGNFMRCDTCLGAGILPLPASAASTLRNVSTDLLPNPTAIVRTSNNLDNMLPSSTLKSPVSGQLLKPSASDKEAPQRKGKECDSSLKEAAKSSSIWTDRIRKAEMKWDIELDESKNFSQRVETIESRALFCRKVLQSTNKSLESEENRSEVTSDMNTSGPLKEIEQAEEKWGLSPPEDYNLTERIEMVEQTAYSFIKRLELWL